MSEEEHSMYEGADRIYRPCDECRGWDERWEIVEGPTLDGRHIHLRSCSRYMGSVDDD